MKNSTGENKTARVLLAIPVYNEENYLDAVLDEVGKYLKNVLVVDDGSTDQSKMILARRKDVCVVSHKKNCGYGRSIIQAFNFAMGCGFDWIITMDCDLQHEPSRIPNFLGAIAEDDADIISGSRYLADSEQQDQPPVDRRKINKLITESINQKLKLNLTDAFCGFKACRLKAIEKLSLTELGYAMPLEFWVEVARHELRVREIPIQLIYNDPTRHFGGDLDNEKTRLEHYRQVFERSLVRAGVD
ncbi:MAG: glycosyltransferase family 2 protein [Sedimentisphaerales bacterium]|nr:glycosyltransferase family 2 protein [Sedimentisphaerales bacterium]